MELTVRRAVVVLLLISGWVGAAHAAPEAEREALARLVHELEVLDALITQAERAADASGRYTFQYPWLREDLIRVRLGIESHLATPRREPREFPALRGDYHR